jgi:valyl-tRNA synthetase
MCLAKKEAKRLEKETKLAAKAAKVPAATEKKVKLDKAKKDGRDAEVEFVNTTPKGEKKGMFIPSSYLRACQSLQ